MATHVITDEDNILTRECNKLFSFCPKIVQKFYHSLRYAIFEEFSKISRIYLKNFTQAFHGGGKFAKKRKIGKECIINVAKFLFAESKQKCKKKIVHEKLVEYSGRNFRKFEEKSDLQPEARFVDF